MKIAAGKTPLSLKVSRRALACAFIVLIVSPLCGYLAYWFHSEHGATGMTHGLDALSTRVGLCMILFLIAWLLGLASLVFGIVAAKSHRVTLIWVIPLVFLLPLTLFIALANIG